MRRLSVCILFVAGVHAQVFAAEPHTSEFSPSTLKLARGQINEVLVLGTPHLSQLPKSFDAGQLSLLNERLSNWQPKAIAIEEISGLQCAYLRSYPQRYSDTVKSYCQDTSAAKAATGLDTVEAMAQAEQLLSVLPASPSAAQRRTLASLFLAAGEPASATVQWLRLPMNERRVGDGLNERLVATLHSLRVRRDETYLIAVPLAAKSGHERVYTMDDHTADKSEADEKAYGEAIMKAWDNPFTAERKRIAVTLQSHLDTPAGVLAMYRAHNERGVAGLVFKSDFGAALEEPSPQHFGRAYVAYWEARNLRMASNIRETMSTPGMRTLVIVGASHKAYLEAYLNQMHDVRVVSTDDTLR
ncbi:DUF5694 domain-containing protein [Rugamonas sp. CCM 8940]|uniref:DUF5694 domain-containing protein n=1 Tax=Rugamonas sp. CCM 8940 TaxID=2765359 RepID=UPI0018F7A2CD|nr:DUF5694 domain-containing protein [Rugamonas sp. CCM 8940]MBJ7313507.1 hypothetical protein [Rugamonas sp. CCM 8940]